MIFGLWKKKTLEEMLAELASCDVTLRDGIPIERLFLAGTKNELEISRSTIENGGFEGLLTAMGQQPYDQDTLEDVDPLSDGVWHFDSECIYDHGDYKRIIDNLCRLTRGDLGFDHVRDYVDVQQRIAWVELNRSSKIDRLDIKIRNDWVDERVFSEAQRRLVEAGSERRFAVQNLGQDCLIVCQTSDLLKRLNSVSGLRFRVEW
jgi:hypothetical protein